MIGPRRVECLNSRAEGLVFGFPYDTEMVNIGGVAFHVWLGDAEPTPAVLDRLLRAACAQRDVVSFSFSDGHPTGFWAHEDFGDKTQLSAEPGPLGSWNVTVRETRTYEIIVLARDVEAAIGLAVGLVESDDPPEPDSIDIDTEDCDAVRLHSAA